LFGLFGILIFYCYR